MEIGETTLGVVNGSVVLVDSATISCAFVGSTVPLWEKTQDFVAYI